MEKMRNYQPQICKACGVAYTPTGPGAKYCSECSIRIRKKTIQDHVKRNREKINAKNREKNKEPHMKKKAAEYSRKRYAGEDGKKLHSTERRRSFLRSLGLSDIETINKIIAIEQCQLCKRRIIGRAPAIDHNHTTGKFRGILCQTCNFMLGNAYDQPWLLRAAANYLEQN